MYIIIWEFIVKTGCEVEFQKIYGSSGSWVEFFKQGDGYIRTELLNDATGSRRYLTVDYWTSNAAYEMFRDKHSADYAKLDRLCSELTEVETHIGSFTTDDQAG